MLDAKLLVDTRRDQNFASMSIIRICHINLLDLLTEIEWFNFKMLHGGIELGKR